MKYDSVQIVTILVIALSVCGCVRRPLDTPADVPHIPKAVDFRMSVREPVTKGVPYGLDDKVEQLSFGISAYTSLPSGEGRNRYLEPTSIVFDAGSGKWSPAREILWPDQGGTVQFFAFGPYAEGVMSVRRASRVALQHTGGCRRPARASGLHLRPAAGLSGRE